jgi:hypothetical protein
VVLCVIEADGRKGLMKTEPLSGHLQASYQPCLSSQLRHFVFRPKTHHLVPIG